MQSPFKSQTRRENLTKLFGELFRNIPAYIGATVQATPNDDYIITVKKQAVCLKRFKEISCQSSYLLS